VAQVGEPVRDQVAYRAVALPPAFDGQQSSVEQDLPLRIPHIRPDDDLSRAVLVLQRHEDRAACRIRLLPQRDDSGRADDVAVRDAAQLRGGFELVAFESGPQQLGVSSFSVQ